LLRVCQVQGADIMPPFASRRAGAAMCPGLFSANSEILVNLHVGPPVDDAFCFAFAALQRMRLDQRNPNPDS